MNNVFVQNFLNQFYILSAVDSDPLLELIHLAQFQRVTIY